MRALSLALGLLLIPASVFAQGVVSSASHAKRSTLRVAAARLQAGTPVPEVPEALPAPAPDRGPTRLSLHDFEGIALANNPTLAQASARVQAARGRWVQVGLYPNPTIGYQGDEIGNEGKAGMQGGFVSQEFVTGRKLQLNRDVVSREIAQAQREFDVQRFRVLNDVRIQFYNAAIAQRGIELTGQALHIASQSVTTTQRLFDAKEVAAGDVLQARVESDMATLTVTAARNRYDAAWRKLAAAAGVPTMTPVSLDSDIERQLPALTWHESLQRILQCSPELAVARANADRARLALTRATAEPIPNVNVQTGVQHDNATSDTVANVQVGIPIPLFNKNQGAIRQAQAELRRAQADIARVELDLQTRLAAVFERYANAKQQVDTYSKSILPNAKRSLELTEAGFQAGETNFLTILTSQRTFVQTNLAYVTALRDLWETTVEIEGYLLTGSLASQSGEPMIELPSGR